VAVGGSHQLQVTTRHRVDHPCHLKLVLGLLAQFKGDVEVPNGDQVAISEAGIIVFNWGREQTPKHSNALHIASHVILRHAFIVDTRSPSR
jgi:hypothetical protein